MYSYNQRDKDLLQEVFDIAVPAVIKQGCKAGTVKTCYYRGPDETRCAIGHVIDDMYYYETLEGKNPLQTPVCKVLALSLDVPALDVIKIRDKLRELQGHHDEADDEDFVASFTERVTEFAENYGLKMPEIEGATENV